MSVYREPLPTRVWRWMRLLVLALAGAAIGARRHAQGLAQREAARRHLSEFRRLAGEAHYFAASTDSLAERAPYYDPRRALAAGTAALKIADEWGTGGEQLPLTTERSALRSELYELVTKA